MEDRISKTKKAKMGSRRDWGAKGDDESHVEEKKKKTLG